MLAAQAALVRVSARGHVVINCACAMRGRPYTFDSDIPIVKRYVETDFGGRVMARLLIFLCKLVVIKFLKYLIAKLTCGPSSINLATVPDFDLTLTVP